VIKRLCAALLILLLSLSPAFAGLEFNGTNQNLIISNHAAITFPDADWTLAFYFNLDDNTGDQIRHIFSLRVGTTENPNVLVYCNQDSHATRPGDLTLRINDDDTTDLTAIQDDTNPCTAVDTWHRVVVRRSADTFSLWVDGVNQGSVANSSMNAMTPFVGLYMASAQNESTWTDVRLCDTAFWTRTLTDAEVIALNNFSVLNYPRSREWVIPMIADGKELTVPLTVSNDGTYVSCPRLFYPH
jgi:hypothetical protein